MLVPQGQQGMSPPVYLLLNQASGLVLQVAGTNPGSGAAVTGGKANTVDPGKGFKLVIP
jgi:hypothetical protein